MATTTAAPPTTDLQQFTADIVAAALRAGATDAEAVYKEGDEFSTRVRLGQVETLKESGSRALGLRVYINSSGGQRTASTSTSDLSPDGIARLISGAVALARITSEDPFAGLPDASEFGSIPGDLGLYYEDVYSLPVEERIAWARRAEEASMAADTRIQNSAGASFHAATGYKILTNSRGFTGEYRRSSCSISATPIAQTETGAMQRDSWGSSARSIALLDSPESVGIEAARRTLRRLGARKVKTQRVPLVFDRDIAASFVGDIFDAANGDSIYRGASFFAGQLNQQVAGENITVIDDGTMPGRFGTSPFDGEGLPSRRTVVVQNGILTNYLLNTYTGRKLNMRSTSNAARGLAGNPGIGNGNLYLEPGNLSFDEIIAGVPDGLYVTELLGHGTNLVTGDYSRGASGLWIENGALSYPVEEITVAGNLKEMFRNITAVGSDLIWDSSVVSPTIRIDGMTIAGA